MEISLTAARVGIDTLKCKLEDAVGVMKLRGSLSSENSLSPLVPSVYSSVSNNNDNNSDNNSIIDLLDGNDNNCSALEMISLREKDKSISTNNSLPRYSPAYKIYEQIGRELLEYEDSMMIACRRRVYSVSQAISIAVSAVLMKLTLVAENHIPHETCEGWLIHGFLIVFEGLLSVIGQEKFMLEDTASAVSALSQYQIKILPLSMMKKKQNKILNFEENLRNEADQINESSVEKVQVGMSGREILLYLPQNALDSLPGEYQRRAHDGGAILKLVSALFSQVRKLSL